MSLRSVLVEDSSPLIQYAPDGAWRDAELNDTLAMSYSGGSYHATSMQGATATLHFRGTGFVVTGGRRPGYGAFSVMLDGQQLFDGNFTPESSPVNVTLASGTGLSNEQHTVVLTNTGGEPIDIDTITFEPQIGSTGNFNVTRIDDTDSRIQYLPQSAWNVNSRPEFQDGTLHFSQEPDASASLRFTGNAIAYYGTVSPDHADISVSIDNETVTMPSGSSSHVSSVQTQVLMWWADGLGNGEHTMTIMKTLGSASRPFVDLDSFAVFSETQMPAARNSMPDRPAISSGIIAGVAVVSVASALLIITGLFLFLRQRHRKKVVELNTSSLTPILPMQSIEELESARPSIFDPSGEGSAFPFPLPAPPSPPRKAQFNYKRTSSLSIAPSYYNNSDFPDDGMSVSEARSQTASWALDPLIPPVPRLKMPRNPMSLGSTTDTVATDNVLSSSQSPRPSRPKRPPTLKF